jgi:methylamine dehydrogenase heavy chain
MVPTDNIFSLNSNGDRAYIYNMQPSSSVVVVDLDKRAVLRTVETPGCALTFPWGSAGFSSLCGDGSLATISTAGSKPTLVKSTSFFDAEHDPVFEASPTDAKTGQTLFVTYSGIVHPVQLGPQPVFGPVWSLQQAAELPTASLEDGALAWRPGGYTPMALHRATGRLYVLMHPGEHWTQKKSGTELWIVDIHTRKVIRRAALETAAGAVRVSQDDHPLLYLMDEKPGLSIRDADTLQELRRVDEDGFSAPIAPPL